MELAVCRLPAKAALPRWVFAISTYETDYLLLKNEHFEKAVGILERTCIIEYRSV